MSRRRSDVDMVGGSAAGSTVADDVKEGRSPSPSPSPSPVQPSTVDRGKGRMEERRWQQQGGNFATRTSVHGSPSPTTMQHSQLPQHTTHHPTTPQHTQHDTQRPGALPPLSHMIPVQPNERRIQTIDPRNPEAAHNIIRHVESPSSDRLPTRRRSTEMAQFTFPAHPSASSGPPYTDPPRHPTLMSLPHSYAHSHPHPHPHSQSYSHPTQSDDSARERRRDGRGLALALAPHFESTGDRSRTSIVSLISPSNSLPSPHTTSTSTMASQDLQTAATAAASSSSFNASSRNQVDQPGYNLVSAGHYLDGRQRTQGGGFGDSGTPSDFLMRTRRSRSPFQVDLTNPADRGLNASHSNVSLSMQNDQYAESSTGGPSAGHSASNASRTLVQGTPIGAGHNAQPTTTSKGWSEEGAAAAILLSAGTTTTTPIASQGGPASTRLQNATPRYVPGQTFDDDYSRVQGRSTTDSSVNTMNATLSAPALTQVFKEWLSDVARQAVSTHDDPELERKLTKALAARSDVDVDPRLKELGHGLLAAPMVPSPMDMASGREYSSAVSGAPTPFKTTSSYPAYLNAEGSSSRNAERHAAIEVDRGETIQEAYRQGYSDGVQAERKRSYQGECT